MSSAVFLGRVVIGSRVMTRSNMSWVVKDIWVDIGYDSQGYYEKVSDTWLRLESDDGNTAITVPYYHVTSVLSDD